MPRVCLTQEQRERDAVNQIREALADGIAIQKARNRLTNRQVAGGAGCGREDNSQSPAPGRREADGQPDHTPAALCGADCGEKIKFPRQGRSLTREEGKNALS